MSSTGTVQRRPYGVACMSCRRAKMRCVLPVSPDEHRCERCARLQRDCVFEAHRRGHWRREQGVERPSHESTTSTANNRVSGAQGFTTSRPFHVASHSPAQASPASDEGSANLGLLTQSTQDVASEESIVTQASGTSSPSTARDDKTFTPPSFVSNEEDAGELSLNVALDPERRAIDGTGSNGNSNKSVGSSQDRDTAWQEFDPVHRKLTSIPSAHFLFEGFMKHFNSLVGFLDPELYTFSYTREASSLLFTTLLSIASTVFRPELHKSLKEHQEMLLGKALLACDSRIETVWVLCLLYFWKDVGDRRGYNFIGYGLQLAKSADWNKMIPGRTGKRQLELETQVRRRRDIDRVWLCLGSLDRTSSMLTNRPFACPRIADECTSRDWVGGDPRGSYLWGEARHTSHYEMSTICWDVYDLIMNTQNRKDHLPDDPALNAKYDINAFQKLMAVFNDGMDEWQEYWAPFLDKVSQPYPGLLASQVYFYGAYMKLNFNSILLHRVLAKNDDIRLPSTAAIFRTCFSNSLVVLQEAVKQAKMDILYYLWDTAHLMIAYSSMMMLKLLSLAHNFPDVSSANAMQVLAGLLTAYSNAAQSIAPMTETTAVDGEKSAVTNGLEAQARLLRTIVTTVNGLEATAADSDYTGPADEASPPWSSQIQSASAHSSLPTLAATETLPTNVNSMMGQLVDEMDFSLDNSFMDSRFVDAGLLFWDEPGIFPETR